MQLNRPFWTREHAIPIEKATTEIQFRPVRTYLPFIFRHWPRLNLEIISRTSTLAEMAGYALEPSLSVFNQCGLETC